MASIARKSIVRPCRAIFERVVTITSVVTITTGLTGWDLLSFDNARRPYFFITVLPVSRDCEAHILRHRRSLSLSLSVHVVRGESRCKIASDPLPLMTKRRSDATSAVPALHQACFETKANMERKAILTLPFPPFSH